LLGLLTLGCRRAEGLAADRKGRCRRGGEPLEAPRKKFFFKIEPFLHGSPPNGWKTRVKLRVFNGSAWCCCHRDGRGKVRARGNRGFLPPSSAGAGHEGVELGARFMVASRA